MTKYSVYQIIYIPTQETVYIGSTKDLKKRWKEHRTPSNSQYISRFMRRVGRDKFDIIEIQSFDNRDDAEVLEGQLVREIKPRCNRSPDGKAGSHYRTEKQRKELSYARKGVFNTGIKNPMYGKKHTPEARQKMSNAQSGDKHYAFGKPANSRDSCWEFADEIVRLNQQGWSQRKLAEKYGCSTKPIRNILKAGNKDQTKL